MTLTVPSEPDCTSQAALHQEEQATRTDAADAGTAVLVEAEVWSLTADQKVGCPEGAAVAGYARVRRIDAGNERAVPGA